jgi:hypothetical protein
MHMRTNAHCAWLTGPMKFTANRLQSLNLQDILQLHRKKLTWPSRAVVEHVTRD